MTKIIQYTSDSEVADIKQQNSDLFLIEIRNILEGNFLVFSDTPVQTRTIDVERPITNTNLVELQDQNLILMDALATTFEEILALQEQVRDLLGGI